MNTGPTDSLELYILIEQSVQSNWKSKTKFIFSVLSGDTAKSI